MPKPKWNLNTIYISERLQESLRPISRCAMTTVVAPMGYGKTTAVNWYLSERTKAETLRIIRISVYSDNLAIFWKSVQEAFARAEFDILRDYPCPTDAAGGGLLVDDLCHALAVETPCYLFIDDFHLLTDKRASLFLCMLTNRLPSNVGGLQSAEIGKIDVNDRYAYAAISRTKFQRTYCNSRII